MTARPKPACHPEPPGGSTKPTDGISKPTTRTLAVLISRLAEGDPLPVALAAAGVEPATLSRWQEEDPHLAQSIEEALLAGDSFNFYHDRFQKIRDCAILKVRAEEALRRAILTGDYTGLSPQRRSLARAIRRAACVPAPGFEFVTRVGADGVTRRHVWQVPKSRDAHRVCGAKTRKGTPCQCKPEPGKKRCRLHGGRSTGARTEAGREALRESNRRRAEARRLATQNVASQLEL